MNVFKVFFGFFMVEDVNVLLNFFEFMISCSGFIVYGLVFENNFRVNM